MRIENIDVTLLRFTISYYDNTIILSGNDSKYYISDVICADARHKTNIVFLGDRKWLLVLYNIMIIVTSVVEYWQTVNTHVLFIYIQWTKKEKEKENENIVLINTKFRPGDNEYRNLVKINSWNVTRRAWRGGDNRGRG